MYKNEVYNDLINNHIVFKYPSIANGALVRLVIYNEKEGYFPFIFQMMSSTDKVTLNYKSLLPHFQYKYRYQYLSNKKWHNLTEYKYIRVEFKNESGVGYLLFLNPDSNYLVVGFAGNGKRPAYHYVGTISEIDTNKLFILDDFSSETSNNSAFYVGTKGNKNVMKNVYELIESIRISNDVNKKNVICIGSSKGGFASLLYALNFNYGGCIIGSPTIYLGNRLLKESNMFKYAKAIAGDTNEKAMRWLNNLVSEEITDANFKFKLATLSSP